MARPRKLNKHRQLIFRKAVLDNRPLPLQELRDFFKGEKYTLDMARSDVGALCSVGCWVELRDCPGDPKEKQIVFLEGPHTDDDRIREGINPEGKKLAAGLAASVICGLSGCKYKELLPPWVEATAAEKALEEMASRGVLDAEMALRVGDALAQARSALHSQREPWPIESIEKVLELVRKSNFAVEEGKKALRMKLHSFWQEPFRLVAIDSGTTNSLLARHLKELRLPVPGSALCSLTVCTNSRRVFELLGPPEVSVKCIVVGGQQKFHGPAIAGAMAELFLRTASVLQFGMCVLGATKVDVERFVVCSDSQEEAAMKQLFMEKSALRIICVDNGKLQIGPGREGYKFASVDPNHIDVIVTNSPARGRNGGDAEFAAFWGKVAAIERRGVPVLVARGPGTLAPPQK